MTKDWQYSQEYNELTPKEQHVLELLTEILFEVQYANMGDKAAARRQAALRILNAIKGAYINHNS